jgi:probable rRNA maturation factor
MSYQAHVRCAPQFAAFRDNLTKAAWMTFTHVKAEPGEVTIVLTDPQSVQELNLKFAGKDKPTDVLAFPDLTLDADSGQMYYGDVIIAVSIAKKQAIVADHPLEVELALLTIHGVLHLLGFDHQEPEDRTQMWERQEEILDKLGYQINLSKEGR